jgi:CO/xanthine dehydrogenase Mo-binding subunit
MAAVATTVHNRLGKRFYGLPMSPPKALAEEIARIRGKPDCQ